MTWYSTKESFYLGAVCGTIGVALSTASVVAYVHMMSVNGYVTDLPSILLTSGTIITAASMLVVAPYLYHQSEQEYDRVHKNRLFFIYGIGLINGPLIGFAISYYLATSMNANMPLGSVDPLLGRLGYGALISVILGGGMYAALAYKLLSKREQESGYTEKRRWHGTLLAACVIGGVGSAISTTLIILIEHYMTIEPSLATWINLGTSLSIGLLTVPLLNVALTPVMRTMEPEEVLEEGTKAEKDKLVPPNAEQSNADEVQVAGIKARNSKTPQSEKLSRKTRAGSVVGNQSPYKKKGAGESTPLPRKEREPKKEQKRAANSGESPNAPHSSRKRSQRSMSVSHNPRDAHVSPDTEELRNAVTQLFNAQNTATTVTDVDSDRKAARKKKDEGDVSPGTARRKVVQEKGVKVPIERVKEQESGGGGIGRQSSPPRKGMPNIKIQSKSSGTSPASPVIHRKLSASVSGASSSSEQPDARKIATLNSSADELSTTQKSINNNAEPITPRLTGIRNHPEFSRPKKRPSASAPTSPPPERDNNGISVVNRLNQSSSPYPEDSYSDSDSYSQSHSPDSSHEAPNLFPRKPASNLSPNTVQSPTPQSSQLGATITVEPGVPQSLSGDKWISKGSPRSSTGDSSKQQQGQPPTMM